MTKYIHKFDERIFQSDPNNPNGIIDKNGNKIYLDPDNSKSTESWEEEFDNKYQSFELCERVCRLDYDRLKEFIRKTIASEREKNKEIYTNLLDQFMESYCAHGIKNRDSCEKCGRLKI